MSDIYKKKLHQSNYHNAYKPGDKVVLEVRFSSDGKTYCYDAESESYYPGDKVLVKVAEGFKDVTVYSAYYYDPEDYPFTTLPLKRIEARLQQKNRSYSTNANGRSYQTIKSEALPPAVKKNPEKQQPSEVETTQYNYRSQASPNKPGPNKILIAFVVLAIIGILQGPTWYKNYVDSQPLDKSEIIGTWHNYEDVHFKDDYTFTVDTVHYLTGKWEIVSNTDNLIQLRYYVTDSQLDSYNDEYQYEMDGYIATKEDVLEWETEACAYEIPPEGVYRYKRSDKRLIITDDYIDYYLYRPR